MPETTGKFTTPDLPGRQPLLVDAKELSAMLGLSVVTIKRMVAANEVPHVRVGPARRSVRFPVDGIRRWVSDGCPRRGR